MMDDIIIKTNEAPGGVLTVRPDKEYRDAIFAGFGQKRVLAERPRIPLHLRPDAARSVAHADLRYDLHVKMMRLNPQGWRQPAGASHRNPPRRKVRTGSSAPKSNRLTDLAYLSFEIDGAA